MRSTATLGAARSAASKCFAIGVLLAACTDDPTLHVAVTNPTGLPIATTTVTDYESPTLHCEDVEFARLTQDQLAAVAIATETIAADGKTTGALTGISRADRKVIVARAFDAMGNLLAAGCAEQGVVDGAVTLPIATLPAATVSLGAPDFTSTDPTGVVVTATDPLGAPLADRAVSWTVYGPAGSPPMTMQNVTIPPTTDGTWQPTEPICTSSNGVAKVHPVPAGVVGGYAVQIRVAWATELAPLYTSLANAPIASMPIVPPTGSTRYCAARVNGATRRLDCLDASGANVVAHEFEIDVDAAGHTTIVAMGTQTLTPETFAVVSVPNGTDRDVYAITTRGHVIGLFNPQKPANDIDPICPGTTTCATPVDDVLVAPPCGNSAGKLLLHIGGSILPAQQVQEMPAIGGVRLVFPLMLGPGESDVALDNAGCVSDLQTTTHQVISVHQGTRLAGVLIGTATRLYYDGLVAPVLADAGVGFLTGSEPRIILTSLDATGVVLVQSVLANAHFVERARYPALSLPDRLVVGQYDTDSQTDMLWTISGKRSGSTIEIGYARTIGDTTQPLEAISSLQAFTTDDLQSIDLTGDGFDDIVLTAQTAGSTHGVAVIAADVPAPAVSFPADPLCAP